VWRCCFHSSLLVQGCRPASRECSVHPRLTGERQHPTNYVILLARFRRTTCYSQSNAMCPSGHHHV
jgi:hypothetical protein